MRRFFWWLGVAAQLYVLFVAIFYSTNIATILAIRGYAPLTWEVMRAIFVRDALMCIPITIAGLFVFAFVTRRFRRR